MLPPALAYSKLIDLLDEAILELQSYEVKSELEECLSAISQTSLQTRLDNLSWRDFCGLESQNMAEFFSICKRSIKLYARRGLIKDEATAKCTLIRLALVYADGKGDIPKAIYFLTDKAQERGFSFNKGTFLHSLLSGYGVKFDNDKSWSETPILDELLGDKVSKYIQFCKTLPKDTDKARLWYYLVDKYKWGKKKYTLTQVYKELKSANILGSSFQNFSQTYYSQIDPNILTQYNNFKEQP